MDDRIAVLFLQPQCNMTCRFCITRDGFDAMSEADVRSHLQALAGKGVRNVIFGGGEPLAWPHDIVEAARFAKGLGMLVQIGTNGISLAPRHMQSPEIDRFILPLESAAASVHDALRIAKGGHHAMVLDRLDALASLGKPVTVSTVITSRNREGLQDLGQFLDQYRQRGGDLHAWHLYRLLAEGREGARNGKELGLPLAEYASLCSEVKLRFPTLRIYKRPDMTRSATVGFFWMEAGAPCASSPFGPAFANPAK